MFIESTQPHRKTVSTNIYYEHLCREILLQHDIALVKGKDEYMLYDLADGGWIDGGLSIDDLDAVLACEFSEEEEWICQ